MKMKKTLALLLALTLLLSALPMTVLAANTRGIPPFVDIEKGAYYYDAVLWAWGHEPQVTNGVDETHFHPNGTCTRGQVVTFLWRASGCPEPSGSSPFVDVQNPNIYYYKAVLWAVGKGITNGTSATTFSPEQGCTRGHVVTFLWRANGKPASQVASTTFVDVEAGAYYYKAVLWAVGKGITNGVDKTHFAPGAVCTRGQIVTFLFRAIEGVSAN